MHSLVVVFAVFLAKFLDPLLFFLSLCIAIIAYTVRTKFIVVLFLCLLAALWQEYYLSNVQIMRRFNGLVLAIGICASLGQVYALIGLKKLKDKSSEFFDKRRKNTDSH